MAITIMCGEDEPAARPVAGYGERVHVRTFAQGCVVAESEANHYDDSDFYATYWDEAEHTFKTVEYASTRGWSYAAHAEIDASPELMEQYRAWLKKCREEGEARARELRLKYMRSDCAKLLNEGVNESELFSLYDRSEQWQDALQILSNAKRSQFRLSMRKQVVNWLAGERKYPTPLSQRQLDALTAYER